MNFKSNLITLLFFFACAPKCSDTPTDRYLEVASVALPEREDEPLEDQLPDLRELGVDDGDEGGVNVSEDGRCCLSLQDGASQQTPEGRRDSGDVGSNTRTQTLSVCLC